MLESQKEFFGTWEQIAAQSDRFQGRLLKLTLLEIAPQHLKQDSLDTDLRAFPPGSLEAELAELGAQIPREEWSKLPQDLTDRLDHYLYDVDTR